MVFLDFTDDGMHLVIPPTQNELAMNVLRYIAGQLEGSHDVSLLHELANMLETCQPPNLQ